MPIPVVMIRKLAVSHDAMFSGVVSVAAATEDGHALNRTTADGRYGLLSPALNAQTDTTYTLALADAGKVVTCENADPVAVSVPLNATAAYPTGTVINVIQKGAGVVTVAGVDGVTLNGANEGSVAIAARWQGVTLLKIGTDTWIASGAF